MIYRIYQGICVFIFACACLIIAMLTDEVVIFVVYGVASLVFIVIWAIIDTIIDRKSEDD